jgi:hypothetical protein
MSVIESQLADELLEGAFRASYRYPADFVGFAAVVQAPGGRSEAERVSVEVSAEGVTVEGSSGLDEWASEQIRSMVAHRLGRPYAEGDGRHPKRVVDDAHPLGVLVELDDGMASSYRVADEQITVVTRQPGPRRFSIAVQERSQARGGVFLPKEFAVFTWAPDGALEVSEAYSDEYVEVDSLLLPSSRRVIRADRDGVTARQLTLADHLVAGGSAS